MLRSIGKQSGESVESVHIWAKCEWAINFAERVDFAHLVSVQKLQWLLSK